MSLEDHEIPDSVDSGGMCHAYDASTGAYTFWLTEEPQRVLARLTVKDDSGRPARLRQSQLREVVEGFFDAAAGGQVADVDDIKIC